MQGTEDEISDRMRNTFSFNWASFFFARQPLLFIVEVLRSHSRTPRSAGLLWTSDRPVEGTST
jgi:hypothetical protein